LQIKEKMAESQIIVGLDIGTTKIVAIAGRISEHGKVEILGIGRAESLGVKRGVVANIEKTVQSIDQAVKQLEESADINVKVVHVGIAGQHIKSLQHRGMLTRDDVETEINVDDINKLVRDMHKIALPAGEKIIHVLPQEFIVDEEQGIKDPVGMAGVRLQANFHVITGHVTAARNITKCVERADIKVSDMILEPLASAEAVLSEEEMEAGVALVDIGGGTTDIAIFQDGIIRHTAVIPFGGNIITEDIKEGCMIMTNQAEQLKQRFGCAIADNAQSNEIVAIPRLRGREPKEISIKTLSQIIQARMEEILEQVQSEILLSGYEKKLIAGIVLTGGGSQLKHIIQLAQLVTQLDARIGLPNEHVAGSKDDRVKNPMYATGIGLIIKGAMTLAEESGENNLASVGPSATRDSKEERSWFKRMIQKSEDWFNKDFTEFE